MGKYTPEWIELLSRVRYLRLLLKEATGINLNDKVVETARKKANTEFRSRNKLEIIQQLKDTYQQIREYDREYERKRDEFMEQLLTEAQKNDEDKRAKAIKQIKHKKESSLRAHRIKKALGRKKNNRLTRLEVPEEDEAGNTIGWHVLCTEARCMIEYFAVIMNI